MRQSVLEGKKEKICCFFFKSQNVPKNFPGLMARGLFYRPDLSAKAAVQKRRRRRSQKILTK
jgi:hypothetical protein